MPRRSSEKGPNPVAADSTNIEQWFAAKGWSPFPFQQECWRAFARGENLLVHAPTGSGKTIAALGAVLQGQSRAAPMLVWITPLRALAADLASAMASFTADIGLELAIDIRTGDTGSAKKQRQKERLPHVLVTTPESLSLLLTYRDVQKQLERLRAVVVDEWHELLGTKRGVQTELALARCRLLSPELQTVGLSATIGNLVEALEVLAGADPRPKRVVASDSFRRYQVRTILPQNIERFPWAGHLGLALVPDVVTALESAGTTLLFTNTRSQAERWYQHLLEQRPEWADAVLLHHSSVDRKLRRTAEERLKQGTVRCVVCTSSLDLGVDFPPVDQVIQVGGPKGVGRLLQRAGRSGHRPGAASSLVCVPTHAFELIEFSAVRRLIEQHHIEPRPPLCLPLDVLVQHAVTIALGGGFTKATFLREVRTTHAFRDLKDDQLEWVLQFVTRGGGVLSAYDQFCRVTELDGNYTVTAPLIARLHRMSIGTIASDGMISVRFPRGGTLGSVEESFLARLTPGETFAFAGKKLELIQLRDMKAFVRLSKKRPSQIPKWLGGRLPLSPQLGEALRREIERYAARREISLELSAAAPVLDLQEARSKLPSADELLIELLPMNDSWYVYLYPFDGRLAHEGLGALLMYRVARRLTTSAAVAANEYGVELSSTAPIPADESFFRELLAEESLSEDLLCALNMTELARRQFREIARVAGLIFQGYPGSQKSTRQLQVSSSLIYDVLVKYDPANLLVEQSGREVLEAQLEFRRLAGMLHRIGRQRLVIRTLENLTPFAFPLWAERIQSEVSNETAAVRIERMLEQLQSPAVGVPSTGVRKRRRNQ